MSRWCRILLLCLLTSTALAQVFPVRTDIHIAPPHSPYLGDYTAPGAQNLVVQVRLNDLTYPEYRCRLRFTIEGSGIAIRSRELAGHTPLVLGGGLTEVLYGTDLHDYLHPDALDFEGLSRREYVRAGRLPDGVYSFSVEVVDFHRGTVVSNRATAVAWMVLHDPPLLNAPRNHTTVAVQDIPNIVFSWAPRHHTLPEASLSTTYTFRLVELWPETRDPNNAFLTQQSFYEFSTDAHHLVYGVAQPQLLPGRKYAWQVQARDREQRELFKNQGRSEVFVFRYGEALPIPGSLRLRWAKPTTLAIDWNPVAPEGEVRYRLQYRVRKRVDGQSWYETWTRFAEKTLYHLQANTEYEMRIRSENAVQESAYSEARIFKTSREPREQFVCSDDITPPPAPDNTVPVFPLAVNDTLHAGGYDVLVRDVMRDGSRYYGSGFAIVPWLNSAKVRVVFEKITVNNRFWLTAGTIKSAWDGASGYLIKHETPLEPKHVPQAGHLDVTVVSVDSLITLKGTAIATVAKDEAGNTVITTTDGHEQVIPHGESAAVVDELGNGYVVDAEGNIAKTTATQAIAAADRGSRKYENALEFSGAGARFGFDQMQHDALSHYYQRLGDGAYVPWKALSTSQPDKITAVVRADHVSPTRLTLEAGGVPIPVVVDGNAISSELQGKANGLEEELLAIYTPGDSIPPAVAGKMNLVTYNQVYHRLVVVPVNNAHLPAGLDAVKIMHYLNGVYSQAVVSWIVTDSPGLTVDLGDVFDNRPAGGLANYSADMKKVLDAYGPPDDNTWYLFIVQTPADATTLGYMPRDRRAGFIFIEPHEGNANSFLKTIAHELGHGAFNLKHTFSEHPLTPGSTDNLMDYSDGTSLYKYQWDNIHQPRGVLGLFEGGESFYESGADASFEWWQQQPPFRKAAQILSEHLESTGVFRDVSSACSDENCIITADLEIAPDVRYTMEVTLPASMDADDLVLMLISEYRVDLWEAFNVRAENIWDEFYHWWRKQNDDLAQRRGWQVSTLNFLADVITAPTLVPAVQGWITGRHWRDGHKLSGWEQAFAILDVMVAEELMKACITNIIVRVGSQRINLTQLSNVTLRLLQRSTQKGLTLAAFGADRIHILSPEGNVVGKIVGETLTILYPGFGGDIKCHPGKTTTLIGRFMDKEDKYGLTFIKDSKLYHYGENLGGINMLNVPKDVYDWPLNKQWLKDALDRGDIIRVVSDPRKVMNQWVNGIVRGKQTPFGQEIEVLEGLGYRFDIEKFEYIK